MSLAPVTNMLWPRVSSVRWFARFPGHVWVHGGGAVRLGSRVVLDASLAPIELHAEPTAEIVLEDGVYIGGGTSIEAQRSIHIGAGSRIGVFCKILDGHFHSLEGDRHLRPAPSFVVVEEGVDIGPHCVLLPRAYLGRGTTLRAGTVVSRRFPPGVVLGGAPAAVRGRSARVHLP
jgi:acetyltransferase-like isoleucine patch superfamily enzyme